MRGTPLRGSRTLSSHALSGVKVDNAMCVQRCREGDSTVGTLGREKREGEGGAPSEVRWLGDFTGYVDKRKAWDPQSLLPIQQVP